MKVILIRIMLTLVFLLTFNGLFFFLLGTENPNSVWISYAFIHIAYFTILFLPVFKTKGEASYYLSSSLYALTIGYFVLELIAGTVFIAWIPEERIWAIITQAALWLIYVVMILCNAWANEATAKSLKKRQQDISQYQSNLMNLKQLVAWAKDAEVKRALITCHEKLDVSSSRQTTESESLDAEIAQTIELLKLNLRSEDNEQSLNSAMSLLKLIEQRKILLKYSH